MSTNDTIGLQSLSIGKGESRWRKDCRAERRSDLREDLVYKCARNALALLSAAPSDLLQFHNDTLDGIDESTCRRQVHDSFS